MLLDKYFFLVAGFGIVFLSVACKCVPSFEGINKILSDFQVASFVGDNACLATGFTGGFLIGVAC